MGYLIEYGMFLAKAVTIVIAIVIIISAISSSGGRQKKPGKKGSLKVSRLNDHLEEMRDTLRFSVLDKDDLKFINKKEKKQAKADQKEKKSLLKQEQSEKDDTEVSRSKRVYVLSFQGNIAADAVDSLREEITAVLSMAESNDEVLVRLESPGGMVHSYGLASSQLVRIKNENIPLTICVDKVAASGGYMMACLADKLVAAPFAIIGSIGVIVQLPNFHRVLKKFDVDYEMVSAGEYKDHRPDIDIDKIATGETWVGTQAMERCMVDDLRTSDECIIDACKEADVYEVEYEFRKSLQDKLGSVLEESTAKLFGRWFNRSTNDIYQ